MRHALLAAFSVITVASILACSGGKVAECNKFVEVVNKTMPEVNKVMGPGGGSDAGALANKMRKLSDLYAALDTELGKLEITDTGLKPKVDAYHEMVRQISRLTGDTARAANTQDIKGLMAASNRITQLANKESALVNDVNSYCSAK